MAASQFAIVYSAASKACRRVVVADTDAEISGAAGVQTRLLPGEAVLFLNSVDHPTDKRIRACMSAIAAAIAPNGQLVTQMRSVVVQGGVVTDFLSADPSVDSVPHAKGQMIQSDLAQVGDLWDGTFFRRVPHFVDVFGNSIPIPANSFFIQPDQLILPFPVRQA